MNGSKMYEFARKKPMDPIFLVHQVAYKHGCRGQHLTTFSYPSTLSVAWPLTVFTPSTLLTLSLTFSAKSCGDIYSLSNHLYLSLCYLVFGFLHLLLFFWVCLTCILLFAGVLDPVSVWLWSWITFWICFARTSNEHTFFYILFTPGCLTVWI